MSQTHQLHDLLSVVAAYFGFTPAEVIGGGKFRKYSHARNIYYYLARERYPYLSYADIGKAVDRNYRVAWRGHRTVTDLICSERVTLIDLDMIRERILDPLNNIAVKN